MKDAAHLASTIGSEKSQEIVVSFVVESLFTNVPIERSMPAALWKLDLKSDADLADRTTLTPVEIAYLVDLVV